MVTGSLARRYAKAIAEVGTAAGNLDKIAADLRSLAKAMATSPELQQALTNPAIRRSDRRKVVDELLTRVGAAPMAKNTIYLLLDGERLSSLPGISRELDAWIEAKSGKVSAELISARPLESVQVLQITAALEKLSGKKVIVSRREDPELLGGVVAKLGDTVYDGSLRTQLQNLREDLAKQA